MFRWQQIDDQKFLNLLNVDKRTAEAESTLKNLNFFDRSQFSENVNISAEPERIEFESLIENRLNFKFYQNLYLIVLMRCSQLLS